MKKNLKTEDNVIHADGLDYMEGHAHTRCAICVNRPACATSKTIGNLLTSTYTLKPVTCFDCIAGDVET